MPGECGRKEAIFLTASDLAKQACRTCVQLDYCGPQRKEITTQLQARGYSGETVVAGETVALGPPKASVDPRDLLRPTQLTWNLERLPDNPAQALQVLRQAQLTNATPLRGAMHASLPTRRQEAINLALLQLRGEGGGEGLDSVARFMEARHIARLLVRQRAISGAARIQSEQELIWSKDVIRFFMRDVFYFHKQGLTRPGIAALYHSRTYYRRLVEYYSNFLPLQQIQQIIDTFPGQAYSRLEKEREKVDLVAPEPAAPQRKQAGSPPPPQLPVATPVSPPVPAILPMAVKVPAPQPALKVDTEPTPRSPILESNPQHVKPPEPINVKTVGQLVPDSLIQTPEESVDAELAKLSFVGCKSPRARINRLSDRLRAALYLAHGLNLPDYMRDDGWYKIEKVQKALGVSSRKEIIDLVMRKIVPKIRDDDEDS